MNPAPPIVFVGPTIAADDAATVLAADYRPPVSLGDVWRAAQERPSAIGIVDGYFHSVPAVWHKEILFALACGIPVYGAASMGALRAGELAPFGMVPIGPIAEGYADGTLVADDEVVLAHASAEDGYRAFSVPLVNVTATMAAAVGTGVVSAPVGAAVVAAARACFYAERRWPAIVAHADLGPPDRDRLTSWLPGGAVDQKRADAQAMLGRIADDLDARAVGVDAHGSVEFPVTDLWAELVVRETPWDDLRDELRLLGVDVTLRPDRLARGELPVPLDTWRACWSRLRAKTELPAPAGDEDALLAWFFGERLGWPDDIDQFLRRRGWTDPAQVVSVASREAAYLGVSPGV